MSRFRTIVDAIVLDLQTNILELAEGTIAVHRGVPWDPEHLLVDTKRHLAVFPLGEGRGPTESSTPLAQGAHEVPQFYNVLVWEAAKQESSRQKADEDAAEAFYLLYDQVFARFYVDANQQLGGSQQMWWIQTELPERSTNARWFRMTIQSIDYAAFS